MRLGWTCLFALAPLWAQVPRIGDIDFYGLHRISAERLSRALQLRPGDPLPPSKADVEERLEKLPGVVQARLEAVCCEAGKAMLFVGIEERGAPHFAPRSAPAGNALLPPAMVDAFQNYLAAPDQSPPQEQLAAFARDNLALVRDVLRNSANYEQRAMAATIIGYAPDKAKVVEDLQYAMQDPDDAVRANAMRSLRIIARQGVAVSPTWFVELLNSIMLGDRVNAVAGLVELSEKNPKVLEQIRERALGSVIGMAQWKSLKYALPPFLLVGRLAGLTEKQIEDAWTNGERDKVVQKVTLAKGR